MTGPQQVSLAWTDNSNNETGFRIERATGAGAFGTTGTVAADATTYSDIWALPGKTHSYRVIAFNGSGDSLPSNTATVTISIPAAPSNLVATASASSPPTVGLTWVDNSSNELGFRIQRATNSGFSKGLTTFTVGANVTAYTDSAVQSKTKYYYRVLAYNGVGNSAKYSNTANAKTP